jgi:hypothetical protein
MDTTVRVPESEFERALLLYVIKHEVARWPETARTHCEIDDYQGNGTWAIRVNKEPETFNLFDNPLNLKTVNGTVWVEGELSGFGEPMAWYRLEDGQTNGAGWCPVI